MSHTGPNPADPSAKVASIDVGSEVLSTGFDAERLAPASQPEAVDPHAGHNMGTSAAPAEPAPSGSAPQGVATTADPHAGHDMPASPSSTAPHAAHNKKPAGKSPAPAATSYSCMHHPDVVSDKPGKCPKCSMDLVPKKPAPKGASNPHGGH